MAEKPHRRFEAIIKVSADDHEELVRAIRNAAETAESYTQKRNRLEAAAGYNSSHSIEIVEDPEMTYEKYFAQLDEWLKAKREQKDEP